MKNFYIQYGTDVAERFLKQKGYTIINKNFICNLGKIDLVAEKETILFFIKVKVKSNNIIENNKDKNNQKKDYLGDTIKYYLQINQWEKRLFKYDLIEIYLEKGLARVNQIV